MHSNLDINDFEDDNDDDDAVSDDGFVYAEVEVVSVEGSDFSEVDELEGEEEEQEELTEINIKAIITNEEYDSEPPKNKEAKQTNDDEESTRGLQSRDVVAVEEETTMAIAEEEIKSPQKFNNNIGTNNNDDNKDELKVEFVERRRDRFNELVDKQKSNQDVAQLCERLKKEIQTHKTHRVRLEQEKREQTKIIKRLKKEAEEVFAPAIEDLNTKYTLAMKDRTMLTIERDKLVKKLKILEAENEGFKTTREEEESARLRSTSKKEKRNKRPTTQKPEQPEQYQDKQEEEIQLLSYDDMRNTNNNSNTSSSSSSLLKKFKRRQRTVKSSNEKSRVRKEKADILEEVVVVVAEEEVMQGEETVATNGHDHRQQRQSQSVVNILHAQLISNDNSPEDETILTSAIHPSKKCIVHSCGSTGGWKMIDTQNGEIIACFENVGTKSAHPSAITFLSFSETGKMLVCGDARGCVSLFDLILAKRVLFFPAVATTSAPSPELSINSNTCVFINDNNNNTNGKVKYCALSSDDKFLAVCYSNSTVFKIFNAGKHFQESSSGIPSSSSSSTTTTADLLLCEVQSKCSSDISKIDFINDSTVIVSDSKSAYRVSF
jgi:hypothetical protein